MAIQERIIPIDRMEHIVQLFGNFDENMKLIEAQYHVNVVYRGAQLKLMGEAENIDRAARAIEALLTLINQGEQLSEQSVRYVISMVNEDEDLSAKLAHMSDG